jgi:hypothetical protein
MEPTGVEPVPSVLQTDVSYQLHQSSEVELSMLYRDRMPLYQAELREHVAVNNNRDRRILEELTLGQRSK